MAGLVVVEGAVVTCAAGSLPTTLLVTSQETETIDGLPVATIVDSVGLTNLPTFGICSLLTAEAGGVSCPCVPATAGTWLTGATSQSIDDIPVLTETDTILCTIGGSITITDPGQTTVIAE